MLKGSKAIVTGGGRGVGLAIAKELADAGCAVVIAEKNKETLEQATKELQGNAIPIHWDVTRFEEAGQKIHEAASLMGGLDIVVNNAGIFSQRDEWKKKNVLETTIDEWDIVIKTNASSVFFIMQAAVNYMLENHIKGNILNINSVAAFEPVFGAYGASKAVTTALTRGWGKMFASNGITINGIAPGPVATLMNNWKEGDPLEHDRIPYGRFITAAEIAKLAMYLLSKDAGIVCGETVTIDGAYAIKGGAKMVEE